MRKLDYSKAKQELEDVRDRDSHAKQEIFEHKKDKIQLNTKIAAFEELMD